MIDRRHTLRLLAGVSALALMPGLAMAAGKREIIVHKTPWCGCCGAWAEHLEEAGFSVAIVEYDDLAPVRARMGVADEFMSCHTGEVAGYAIEGHVPAADIEKLLADRPKAIGLAVPGMPMGSPGMDFGPEKEPYDVLLLTEGGAEVFASH